MKVSHHAERHQHAAEEFNEIQNAHHGAALVESISAGLNLVRELAFLRIHNDVERYFGLDSMCVPLSLGDSEREAKVEIDVWQIAEAGLFVHSSGCVDDQDWMRKWLGALRLGRSFENDSVQRLIENYWTQNDEDRRRHFSQRLEHVYPEASRAPLVLYQLWPLGVRIVMAVAFGKTEVASKLRKDQAFWLPGIIDCQKCHGSVLDNGERCAECESPIWNYKWLLSAD